MTPKNTPTTNRVPLVGLADLILESARPTDWLIEDVFGAGEVVLVSGASHSGKTYLLLDLGLAVAYGRPWLGRFETKQSPVIYAPSEGRAGIGRRVTAAIEHHCTYDSIAPFYLFPEVLDVTQGQSLANLGRATEQTGAGLVIVDVLRDATPGVEENSAQMGDAFGKLRDLAQYTGATVLVAHHLGKDATKGSRGHSSIKDKADQEVLVKAAAVVDGLGGIHYTTVTIENSKNRNLDNWGRLDLDLRKVDPESSPVIIGERGATVSEGATKPRLHLISSMLELSSCATDVQPYRGCTLSELADALGQTRQAVDKTLGPLVTEDFVDKDETGKAHRYTVTAKGQRLCATNVQPPQVAGDQCATNLQHPIGAGGLQVSRRTVVEELLEVRRQEEYDPSDIGEPADYGDEEGAAVLDLGVLLGERSA